MARGGAMRGAVSAVLAATAVAALACALSVLAAGPGRLAWTTSPRAASGAAAPGTVSGRGLLAALSAGHADDRSALASPSLRGGAAGAALVAVVGLAVVPSRANANAATAASSGRRGGGATALRYTTQVIQPALQWVKIGAKGQDLQPGDLRISCLAGCDICVGKTSDGRLFAVGDKAPPTGISFSVGAEVRGAMIVEPQYGNAFDVFTGQPDQTQGWCPSPPIIGPAVGALSGGPTAIAVFDVRETLFGGDVEVLVDTNAKRAYEADYWKGLLDAQGKDDGSFY